MKSLPSLKSMQRELRASVKNLPFHYLNIKNFIDHKIYDVRIFFTMALAISDIYVFQRNPGLYIAFVATSKTIVLVTLDKYFIYLC